MIDIFESDLLDECMSSSWDLGNKVLYDLCANNFTHDTDERIIAKVWLIGRSYAAAIERRSPEEKSEKINDTFYTKDVVSIFKDQKIDEYLSELSKVSLNEDIIPEILDAHKYLIDIIYKITILKKRSLSSKYLHFHLPGHYFLYDSRASLAIRQFKIRFPERIEKKIQKEKVDEEYGKFFYKCFLLQKNIYEKTGRMLTPRQIDNLLMKITNEKLQVTPFY